MATSMINAMCRCCASEGVFKDVKSTYHWMGDEEIYADMLKECFDVSLFIPEEGAEGGEGGICEVCITQLRNAVNFKKQVLHTEEQFKRHVQNKLFKPNIVKVEVEPDDDNDSDDNNASAEEGYSGAEYEIPIKKEVPEEPKPKKRAAAVKASTSRAKKAKTEIGEPSTKRGPYTKKNNKDIETTIKKDVKSSPKKVKKRSKEILDQLKKHRENFREILQSSNATPISTHGCSGFTCYYCKKPYSRAEDLKRHTRDEHRDKVDDGYTIRMSCVNFIIRLDITALHCTICNKNIDTLADLCDHLRVEHGKIIHADVKHAIIPFKFETENLQCCICKNIFDKFKTLLMHMSAHYRNYECEECGAGFITLNSLGNHMKTHKSGDFVCDHCPKVFTAELRKKRHMRCMHGPRATYKCVYCGETFNNTLQREAHLGAVHGVNMPKCRSCGRVFSNRNLLRKHVKRTHLMDKRYGCPDCDKKFFTNQDLSEHSIMHTGARPHQCKICLKFFKRVKALKRHQKLHEDKNFKCEDVRCDTWVEITFEDKT